MARLCRGSGACSSDLSGEELDPADIVRLEASGLRITGRRLTGGRGAVEWTGFGNVQLASGGPDERGGGGTRRAARRGGRRRRWRAGAVHRRFGAVGAVGEVVHLPAGCAPGAPGRSGSSSTRTAISLWSDRPPVGRYRACEVQLVRCGHAAIGQYRREWRIVVNLACPRRPAHGPGRPATARRTAHWRTWGEASPPRRGRRPRPRRSRRRPGDRVAIVADVGRLRRGLPRRAGRRGRRRPAQPQQPAGRARPRARRRGAQSRDLAGDRPRRSRPPSLPPPLPSSTRCCPGPPSTPAERPPGPWPGRRSGDGRSCESRREGRRRLRRG